MLYVYIKCDTNDGDYISNLSRIQDSEDLDDLVILADALRKRGPKYGTTYSFSNHECDDETYHTQYPQLDPDLMDYLVDTYFPSSEHGFHSIKEFKLLEVLETDDLLKEG